MIQQSSVIKIQQLFSPQGNASQSYFYASNKIISTPLLLVDFFRDFADFSTLEQEQWLTEIVLILEQVTTNAYSLNQVKDNAIIHQIVQLLPNYVDNYLIFNKLLTVLELLLKSSSMEERLVDRVLKKIISEYYTDDKKIDSKLLFAALNIFKSYFNAKIAMEKQPEKMMIFHGSRGLELSPIKKKEINWLFSNGMSIYFWINLENIKFGSETPLPKLFTLYSPNNGGMECYLIDNKVFYRTLGSKYSEPQIGSNGLSLGELQTKKWVFFGIEHEASKRLLGRSHLIFHINGKKASYNLSPPSISSKQKMKIVFFDRIYCKTSSIAIFPFFMESEISQQLNKIKNSIDLIKNPKAYIFQERQGNLYERSELGYCADKVLSRSKEMNFDHILPLLHVCKFTEKNQYPILNEALSLFILFLYKSSTNQMVAQKKNYPRIMAEQIKTIPSLKEIFNEETIRVFLHIKQTITNSDLLAQYHGDFLWAFVDADISLLRKQELLQIIKNNFTQNVAYFSTIVGLDQMINSINKLSSKNITRCCEKHYNIMVRRFDNKIENISSFGEEVAALDYILKIIELYIQNEKVDSAIGIYKLCRLLSNKHSPCFTLSLMGTIKKILTEKFSQKLNSSQSTKILDYLTANHVQLLFIQTIENSFFAEIKAESVRIIYSLLLKKMNPNEQKQISQQLSRSLWKINEEKNAEEVIYSSKTSSPIKNAELKKEQERQQADQISEEQEVVDEKYEEVGPQPPKLTNKLKGKQSFNFNFVNKPKDDFDEPVDLFVEKEPEIMEEEKTNENPQIEDSELKQEEQQQYYEHVEPKPKKKKFSLNLNIDTEAINKMYTFGGQKGQQIVVSEEEEKSEIEKIRKLAKKCVAAMRGQKFESFHGQSQTDEFNKQMSQSKAPKIVMPPQTTSHRVLKSRQNSKTFQLKLIDEDEEQQESGQKPNALPSPNFHSKKSSKSPTSMNSISEQNMVMLYNSLMENCIGSNYQIQIPSILCVLFQWIPQTNLEVKFIFDLLLVLESDDNKNEKIRVISKMAETYDFLCELAYKALLFEELGQKRLFTQKLEELAKKIFGFVFREDPECSDKYAFISDWAQAKSKQYHPKCLFLTTRYVFFLLMDSVEEELFTNNKNDKLMERNFQYLGITITRFCKMAPIDESNEYGVYFDDYGRIMLRESFEMIQSVSPYFTCSWADYLICQKYYLLFKKFYCTDWYAKTFKMFKSIDYSNLSSLEQFYANILTSQIVQLSAQAHYYMKNSFIFTLIDINRNLFIEKALNEGLLDSEQQSQTIWQTILIILFADINKDKNQKNNSEFVLSFLKNCKTLAVLNASNSVIIIPSMKIIKSTLQKKEPSSGAQQSVMKTPQLTKSSSFIDSLLDSYVNMNLFEGEHAFDFQNFKINFEEVWIPGQNHNSKSKSEIFSKFVEDYEKIQAKRTQKIEQYSQIIEEEMERFCSTQILIETASRHTRNDFRKIWKNLRTFGGPWTHLDFSLQNDTLFNKNLFAYQRYESSPFYIWRVAKHQSKYRIKYLLDPLLIEPKLEQKMESKDKLQIGLNKALIYFSESKLLLGKRVLFWLANKSSKGEDGLDIAMDFKKVRLIKTLTARHGFLAIINDKLLFINSFYHEPESHLSIKQYDLKYDKGFCKIWPLEFIKQIFRRRYVNRKRALQINFIHGKSIMLEFYENDQDDFVKKIIKLKSTKCPNFVFYGHKSLDARKIYQSQALLKKWSTYEITNFEYLMEINNLSGRSYNDLTQYPVTPWTLINFDEKLVLSDSSNYRNLALPMGALGSEARTEGFRERFQNMADIEEQRFHYGTHYSSPGIIYHFMVRLYPFTEGAILLQGGKFDFADRLFFSIMDSFKNATSQFSDVRQLLPEMYSIPEVYLNINKLDMGVMQNKKRVHNVELPKWARQNPYLYVSKLRKGFEEQCISMSINKWIDLIYGYKQKGEQAAKSLNCFVHLTYEDSVDFDKIDNEKNVKAIETQVLNFGQTPSQLFAKPHPERAHISTLQLSSTICDPNVEPRIYRPSKNSSKSSDLLKDQKQPNAIRQAGESIVHMKWFKDSKLVFLRRNGEMLFYKWHSSQAGFNKVPFQCTIEKEKSILRMTKNSFQNNQFFDPSLKTNSFPVQFINAGYSLALGGHADGKILLIDTDTNNVIETYTEHEHTVCCMISDVKDNFLITGDISGHVIIWRITANHRLSLYNQFKDHTKQVLSIFISYDLRCLFTSSLDGSVYGYNIMTGKKMKVFYHPKRLPINQVVVSTSPLAVVVLFCNAESIIYCYSINGQLIQRVSEKQFEHFLCPVLIRDSFGFEHIAYGNELGQTIIRTLPSLDSPSNHVVARDALVNKICLSNSGRFLVTGCSDGELSVITIPESTHA